MPSRKISIKFGAYADSLHFIDGFPIPTCKFPRAYFSSTFKGEVVYGYCASKKEHYYGFKGHVVINSIDVVTAATFTPANIDERDVCRELVENIRGLLRGDKGLLRPERATYLFSKGLYLPTPLKSDMKENRPKKFLDWMKSERRLIETVIGN